MERKRIEIEAKYSLKNINQTKELLENKGKKIEKDIIQLDTYYTPAHENFLDKTPISEWLRLRKTKEEITINYKNWNNNNNNNNKITCKELEVALDDYNGMEQILEALDFKKIICVNKVRNTWEYKNIKISVDEIKDLGNFIELEFKTNIYNNEEESMKFLESVINELNIEVGTQIHKGYPQLLMEQNNI